MDLPSFISRVLPAVTGLSGRSSALQETAAVCRSLQLNSHDMKLWK